MIITIVTNIIVRAFLMLKQAKVNTLPSLMTGKS